MTELLVDSSAVFLFTCHFHQTRESVIQDVDNDKSDNASANTDRCPWPGLAARRLRRLGEELHGLGLVSARRKQLQRRRVALELTSRVVQLQARLRVERKPPERPVSAASFAPVVVSEMQSPSTGRVAVLESR